MLSLLYPRGPHDREVSAVKDIQKRQGFECQTLKPLLKMLMKKVMLVTSPKIFHE